MTDRETTELLKKAVAALEKRANAQPCDDAISRYDALNAVTMAVTRREAIENIELIPNTYQRKTGRWIDIQYFKKDDTYYRPKCPFCSIEPKEYSNYCPNCGADMRESEGEKT